MKQSLLSQRGEKVLAAKKTSHVQRLLNAQKHKERLYTGLSSLPESRQQASDGVGVPPR